MWHHAYIGIPFLDGGRTVAGADCWGLVRLIYRRELSVDLPSYGDTSAADLIRVARTMATDKDGEAWQSVEPGELKPFDVVVMRFIGRSLIGHVGLAIDRVNVLHIERATSAVIVPRDHWSIRERIACYRRHRIAIPA